MKLIRNKILRIFYIIYNIQLIEKNVCCVIVNNYSNFIK